MQSKQYFFDLAFFGVFTFNHFNAYFKMSSSLRSLRPILKSSTQVINSNRTAATFSMAGLKAYIPFSRQEPARSTTATAASDESLQTGTGLFDPIEGDLTTPAQHRVPKLSTWVIFFVSPSVSIDRDLTNSRLCDSINHRRPTSRQVSGS